MHSSWQSTRVHFSIQGSAGAPQASACRQSSARERGQTDSPQEEARKREDEQRRAEDLVQKLTDKTIAAIEAAYQVKEADLLSI